MASPPADKVSDTGAITITQETDSVYRDITGDVLLADSKRKRPLTLQSNPIFAIDTISDSSEGRRRPN